MFNDILSCKYAEYSPLHYRDYSPESGYSAFFASPPHQLHTHSLVVVIKVGQNPPQKRPGRIPSHTHTDEYLLKFAISTRLKNAHHVLQRAVKVLLFDGTGISRLCMEAKNAKKLGIKRLKSYFKRRNIT